MVTLEHPSVLRMDSVCNGTWWRDVAVNAFIASGGKEWESAAHAVADQYAEKLGKACRMNSIVVPVYRRAQRQPVYHLIFLTRASHGVWEFGDAIAKAREV